MTTTLPHNVDPMRLHNDLQPKADALWSQLAETRRLRRAEGKHNPEKEATLQNQIATIEREKLKIYAELAENRAACAPMLLRHGETRESILAYASGCRARMLQPFF